MKAVLLPTTLTENFGILADNMPEYLFPIANKPIAEHIVELLAKTGIKNIIMMIKHMPLETEGYFGKGERWGVNISYLPMKEYRGIGDCLTHVQSSLKNSFLCLPVNIVTDLNIETFIAFHKETGSDLTIAKSSQTSKNSSPISSETEEMEEFLPFIMTPQVLRKLMSRHKAKTINQLISSLSPKLNIKTFSSSYNLKTINFMNDYLEANQSLLEGFFENVVIPIKEREKGIRIGRQSNIHHDVLLNPPLMIGDHCVIRKGVDIGKGTVIGDNVVVDENASIKGSIIMDGSYIGADTEVKKSIVIKNCIYNVSRKSSVCLEDDLVLGDLGKRSFRNKGEQFFNQAMALFLTALFSPIMANLFLLHIIFPSKKYLYKEEYYGSPEMVNLKGGSKPKPLFLYSFKSSSALIRKLPWFLNVLKGRINLVGNAPLFTEEAARLKEEWETMRFKAPIGIFTSWELEKNESLGIEERIVLENYYANTRTFKGDVKILLKSLSPFH